jgi:hypothetical protein
MEPIECHAMELPSYHLLNDEHIPAENQPMGLVWGEVCPLENEMSKCKSQMANVKCKELSIFTP